MYESLVALAKIKVGAAGVGGLGWPGMDHGWISSGWRGALLMLSTGVTSGGPRVPNNEADCNRCAKLLHLAMSGDMGDGLGSTASIGCDASVGG